MVKMLKKVVPTIMATAPGVVLAQGGFQNSVNIPSIAGGNDLVGAITAIVNFLLVLAAIVATIYLILGGVQYIISAGEEDRQEKAKNTILYAIIGLIVIGLSAVIANFVLSAIPG